MSAPGDRLRTMLFEDFPADTSLADPLPAEPFALLGHWLTEAQQQQVQPNPDAITLATVDPDGRPTARMLLCRGFEPDPGYVVFYTNRRSRKGLALRPHGYAAIVFHWDTLGRQVRLEGPVVHAPDEESDAYFAQRPRASQLSAWASDQSETIGSRLELLDKLRAVEDRYGHDGPAPVPRPPHWGGYRLYIESVELWVGSLGRAHDRGEWSRTLAKGADGFYTGGPWRVRRLQP